MEYYDKIEITFTLPNCIWLHVEKEARSDVLVLKHCLIEMWMNLLKSHITLVTYDNNVSRVVKTTVQAANISFYRLRNQLRDPQLAMGNDISTLLHDKGLSDFIDPLFHLQLRQNTSQSFIVQH